MQGRNVNPPISLIQLGSDVRAAILSWFKKNGRVLPWRTWDSSGRHAWQVLVSEVMLQQTQAQRIVEKFPRFIEQFPTAEALAGATPAEAITAWRGLGYNSRVLRLRDAAAAICRDHRGRVPDAIALLRHLPGVGEYTARAVACFAFGARVAPVDVNVVRVVSRIFYGVVGIDARVSVAAVDLVASRLVPRHDPSRWGQALMEFGALRCMAKRPICDGCPVNALCLGAFPAQSQFHRARRPGTEPMVLGEPRRVWRGRIVELLRSNTDGLTTLEISNQLAAREPACPDRLPSRTLDGIVAALRRDGFLELTGIVSEDVSGDIPNDVRIRLRRR